jgi:hypothetical protein
MDWEGELRSRLFEPNLNMSAGNCHIMKYMQDGLRMRLIVSLIVLMSMIACSSSRSDNSPANPQEKKKTDTGGPIVEDDSPNPAIDNSVVQNFSAGLTFKILDTEKLKRITGYYNMMVAGEVKQQRKVDGVFYEPSEPFCYFTIGDRANPRDPFFNNSIANGEVLKLVDMVQQNKVGSYIYVNLKLDRNLNLTCAKIFTDHYRIKDLRETLKGTIKISTDIAPPIRATPSTETLRKNLEFARDQNGKIIRLKQPEAIAYCPRGTHLATMREVANYAMSLGAKGFVDSTGFDHGTVRSYYFQDDNGHRDNFSYDNAGYRPPSGDLALESIWTQSSKNNYLDTFAGVFNLGNGTFSELYKQQDFAVACVKSQ